MSISCGFYDSLNSDRQYNAKQMSSIFDGIIRDGIFASIGTAMVVQATTGLTVNVGIGRAWFNHTWTYNDAILPLVAPEAEVILDRIDAVVLEIDATDEVRNNTIKFVSGTPASTPSNPTLISTERVHQYPLCYIYRAAGSTAITAANITNMVGTTATPFVTGPLSVISINELLTQWESEFDDWFETVQNTLGSDVAGNLLNLITTLQTKTKNILAQHQINAFSLPASSWVFSSENLRYEASIANTGLTENSRVHVVLDDSFKGKHAIYALDPVSGSLTLCIDAKAPDATITGRLIIDEVRA